LVSLAYLHLHLILWMKKAWLLRAKARARRRKVERRTLAFLKSNVFMSQDGKKKNKPQMAASAEVEEFAKSFEEDFCFIACMASSIVSDIWFVDSGASCHMMGHKEFFSRLQEGGVNLHIELGDDTLYKAQGIGTITFQRGLGKPLQFVDVLYVPGSTKNLISVSTLEDKRYEVFFRKGKVFVRPTRSGTKMDRIIGVGEENLYRLQFEPARALVNTTTNMGELCHRRMTHLHFGALGHLRQAVTGLPKFIAEKHDPCKGCAMGKYARRPFPLSEHRSKVVSNLIHSDVCGHMSNGVSEWLQVLSIIH
jgi:hypothetical protein